MINKIKTLMLSICTMLVLAVPAMMPATALAAVSSNDIKGGLCSGANINIPESGTAASTEQCKTGDATNSNINTKITHLINWLSAIIGIVAVIMIIFGGFKYITSGGNDTSVASAKKTILYALIGLVIVALSQLIVKFVLQNVQ
jgi:ribosome-associated translation inhibitor RaiA